MKLGNKLTEGSRPVVGKIYWWINVGKNAHPYRRYDLGWRGFDLGALRYKEHAAGEALPHLFNVSFAFWLPFEIN